MTISKIMVMLYILLLFAVYVVFLLSSFLARSIALYNHLNFALSQVLFLILIDFSIEFFYRSGLVFFGDSSFALSFLISNFTRCTLN